MRLAATVAVLWLLAGAAAAADPAAARFPTPRELGRAVNRYQSEAIIEHFAPQVVIADLPTPRATHVRCAASAYDPGEVDCRFMAVWSLPGAGRDRYVAALRRSEDGWRIIAATSDHRGS